MKRLILISACFAATVHAYAQSECVKTAVNMTGQQKTLTTSGAKSVTSRQTFVYYERKRLRKNDSAYALPGVAAQYPSEPLLLNSSKDVAPVEEKYNVSVTLPERTLTACPDSVMNVAANLNIERIASYTGNYPEHYAPQYHKVSKRSYKVAARKMRKIERKQEKIARRAEVNVETRSTTDLASR
ncbi:hypothetical protein GCM10023093_14830 [Nemorincola caseinilytica]|uniref:Uncharacterized protein n=1 Tax=Nemorincola caseinilytica TaxID=2054315 RepID=A0ABP8NF95_9BACT